MRTSTPAARKRRLEGKLTFEFPDLNGEERLRELMLYIADKCQDDPAFGATKLNKILFFSDFLSFREYGEPITGVAYMRLDNGPMPRPLVRVRDQMIESNEAILKSRLFHSHTQQRLIALRAPNLELFRARDIAVVDAVIEALWLHKAKNVSDPSHDRAWRIAEDREDIPYEAVMLSDEQPTESDIRWAQRVAKENGWDV